jgi:2-iminobutanoate/2-iminopropanoate deaminase
VVRSITVPGVAQHVNPVPNAAVHNGVLCTSGILGKDAKTGEYPVDIDTQARLCFQYLRAILTEAGADFQDVVKVDLYFRDKSDRSVVNPYWLACWPDPARRPARQAHQSPLPEGCLFQLTAMAVLASGASDHDTS